MHLGVGHLAVTNVDGVLSLGCAASDVTVNGVHQNHVEKVSVRSGAIGVQLEGYPIEFRNLWVERL